MLFLYPDVGTGTPLITDPLACFLLFMLGYFCLVVDVLFYLSQKPWAEFLLNIAFPGRHKE